MVARGAFLSVTAPDATAVETVDVALSSNLAGTYSNRGIGTLGANGTTYVLAATEIEINASLEALVFTPSDATSDRTPQLTADVSGLAVTDDAPAASFVGGDTASTVFGGSGSVTLTGGSGGGLFFGSSAGANLLTATAESTTIVGGGSGDSLVAAAAGGMCWLPAVAGGNTSLSLSDGTRIVLLGVNGVTLSAFV
jgi:hypothetical protein